MLCVCFYFIFMLFFWRGCTWIVLDGEFDSDFCKSKDFKAFLRCSCVHFFQFVFAITIIICISLFVFLNFICKDKKKSVFQKEACYLELRKIRKAFICKLNLTMQNHFDGLVTS